MKDCNESTLTPFGYRVRRASECECLGYSVYRAGADRYGCTVTGPFLVFGSDVHLATNLVDGTGPNSSFAPTQLASAGPPVVPFVGGNPRDYVAGVPRGTLQSASQVCSLITAGPGWWRVDPPPGLETLVQAFSPAYIVPLGGQISGAVKLQGGASAPGGFTAGGAMPPIYTSFPAVIYRYRGKMSHTVGSNRNVPTFDFNGNAYAPYIGTEPMELMGRTTGVMEAYAEERAEDSVGTSSPSCIGSFNKAPRSQSGYNPYAPTDDGSGGIIPPPGWDSPWMAETFHSACTIPGRSFLTGQNIGVLLKGRYIPPAYYVTQLLEAGHLGNATARELLMANLHQSVRQPMYIYFMIKRVGTPIDEREIWLIGDFANQSKLDYPFEFTVAIDNDFFANQDPAFAYSPPLNLTWYPAANQVPGGSSATDQVWDGVSAVVPFGYGLNNFDPTTRAANGYPAVWSNLYRNNEWGVYMGRGMCARPAPYYATGTNATLYPAGNLLPGIEVGANTDFDTFSATHQWYSGIFISAHQLVSNRVSFSQRVPAGAPSARAPGAPFGGLGNSTGESAGGTYF